jgi:molecular chaperone GrpE
MSQEPTKDRPEGAGDGERAPADPLAAAIAEAAAALDESGRPAEKAEEPRRDEAAQAQIEALTKEVEDWKGKAYRAAADLDNSRKRFAKERDEQRKFAVESLLKDMLPVADNLQRAVDHAGESEGALLQGVQLVLRQLLGTLERHGAKPFDPKGQPFDPTFHEAMTQMPRADVEPGTVIETFQQGWMLHDRLVRPAMVIVSRAPDETGAQA